VVVIRKSDRQKGSLEFTHRPHVYFNFVAARGGNTVKRLAVLALLLAAAVGLAPAASADPIGQYNDGLDIVVCRLLMDEGWSGQQVADELVAQFGPGRADQPFSQADAWKFMREAVARKCPTALEGQ
jgi:hypothetical protein